MEKRTTPEECTQFQETEGPFCIIICIIIGNRWKGLPAGRQRPAVRGQGSAFWKITGSEAVPAQVFEGKRGSEAVPAQVFEGKRGSEAVPRNMLYKQKGYRNIKDRAGTGDNRSCISRFIVYSVLS